MKRKNIISIIAAILVTVMVVTSIFVINYNKNTEEVINLSDVELKEDGFVVGSNGLTKDEFEQQYEGSDESDDIIMQVINNNKKEDVVLSNNTVEEVKRYDDEAIKNTPYDLLYLEEFNSGKVEYSQNSIMIKFKTSDNANINKELRDAGIGKLEHSFDGEDYAWYVGYLTKDANINETMTAVRNIDSVVIAEYNFKYETAADISSVEYVSENELINEQDYLESMDIIESWNLLNDKGINPGGKRSITVAVIDTGVDYNHEDLRNNMWVNAKEIPNNGVDDDGNGYIDDYYGVDIISKNGSGMDDHGHGTHVAGIIAAENNKTGVAGIAYNTKVIAIKAGDNSGYFLQSNIASAVMYAYENGADVINMSFGGAASSVMVQDALETAYLRCVLVASAGNDGMPNEPTPSFQQAVPTYPADHTYVLGVMSCGKNGDNYVESYFSNWDLNLFNKHEYEVYAIGESVMSTLPGNKYGKLSGTSMAAPVVASQAALLRSYYQDRETYPTKFIYGQIIGTADNVVKCGNDNHKSHNLPGVVNFVNSLVNHPKPDLGLSDYTIFDSERFSADLNNIANTSKNNGDGIVDSGETVAIGFTVKNRWGMSKDTIIHIDSLSSLGVENPYVTILNNDLNYESVGTYSEQDSGKIIENDQWVGWRNPFYVRIAENCPNNYTVTLNITINYKNGLDEEDTQIYETKNKVTFVVRRGTLLPNKITQDMTLTNDNYYIIPNSMVIMEGATLTIEKGTKVQFWCSDPSDSYADTAMTYLKVDGNLICNGTEEEPIEMFPSDWMDAYRVNIYRSGKGFVSLNHTNVRNPVLDIDEAYNCEFTQTYPHSQINYRYLSGGKVLTSSGAGSITIDNAKNCSFYKLGGNRYNSFVLGKGTYDGCIFVDSFISYSTDMYDDRKIILENCVFYGNNNFDHGEYDTYDGNSSSLTLYEPYKDSLTTDKILFNSDTDTIYAYISMNRNAESFYNGVYNHYQLLKSFANMNGFDFVKFETEDELDYVVSGANLYCSYVIDKSITDVDWNWKGRVDAGYVPELEKLTKDQAYIWIYRADSLHTPLYVHNDMTRLSSFIFEIPNLHYVENIKLNDSIVTLGEDSTYQIKASIYPEKVYSSKLIYEVEDSSILDVDENGLIVTKQFGSTRVKVFSEDRAIYSYLTVNVMPTVALESIEIEGVENNNLNLQVGDRFLLTPSFAPSNTTMRHVTYNISDESVIEISENDMLIAKEVGESTVTLNGENNKTYEFVVNVTEKVEYIEPESIVFRTASYSTDLSDESFVEKDQIALKYDIYPKNSSKTNVVWESSNPAVCYVDETGKLVKVSEGSSSIRVRIAGTEFYDDLLVKVTENLNNTFITKAKIIYDKIYAVSEKGELFVLNSVSNSNSPFISSGVVDIISHFDNSNYLYLLSDSGDLKQIENQYTYNSSKSIKLLDHVNSIYCSGPAYGRSAFAIDDNGIVYAWGHNEYGQLGIGNYTSQDSPQKVDIEAEIVNIVNVGINRGGNTCGTTAFLDNQGNVYISGTEEMCKRPELKYQNVRDIYHGTLSIYIAFNDGKVISVYYDGYENALEDIDASANLSEFFEYYIEDGLVFIKVNSDHSMNQDLANMLGMGKISLSDSKYKNSFNQMSNIRNAKEVFVDDNGHRILIVADDGRVYGTGNFSNFSIGSVNVPTIINIGNVQTDNGYISIKNNNVSNKNSELATLYNEVFDVEFEVAIEKGDYYSGISLCDSSNRAVSTTTAIDFNHFRIAPAGGFIDGERYKLTIPLNSLIDVNKKSIQPFEIEFIYHNASIAFANEVYEVNELKNYGNLFNLNVNYSDNCLIDYSSSDESVLKINQDGSFAAIKQGYAIVTATIKGTGVSDSAYVFVGNPELEVVSSNIDSSTIREKTLRYKFNMPIESGTQFDSIKVMDSNNPININKTIKESELIVNILGEIAESKEYKVIIPQNSLTTLNDKNNFERQETFSYVVLPLEVIQNNLISWILNNNSLEIVFNQPLLANSLEQITVEGYDGLISSEIDHERLLISFPEGLEDAGHYTLTVPSGTLKTDGNLMNSEYILNFVYEDLNNKHESQKDEELYNNRLQVNNEYVAKLWQAYKDSNYNYQFHSNVILNRLSNDDVNTWLRITVPDSEKYKTIPLGYNYWGTNNENIINKQILDFDDYQLLIDLDESNYLTEAPSNTFPFVVDAYLTVDDEKQNTVGNETVVFVVEFNRAMDAEYGLEVAFGSAYPYRDYEVEGEFVDETTWCGEVTLKTLIENGYQYFSISKGRTIADENNEHLKLYTDWGRFPFSIDTSSALALTMFASAEEQGISLRWEQDDFDTLAGYNLYRSTSEDGFYTRINKTVIPADTKTWIDNTVEPGVKYFYNFTVVKTDLNESEPSGKVVVTSRDTMPPNIYHSPVAQAFTDSNLIISATITDNVAVSGATLYYRTIGENEWHQELMLGNLNDKFTGIIYSEYVTLEGIEYYIDAYDGVKHTLNGSSENPYVVIVQQQISTNSLGDVDGNGQIELKDAMMLLQAVNDRLNLDAEQFARADLDGNGELSAVEALRIIKYVNGSISSII